MIINGQRVSAGRHFDVKNPATGATVGRAPNASIEDLDQAVAAAEAAIGLAILVTFFRNRGDIAVDDASVMKG